MMSHREERSSCLCVWVPSELVLNMSKVSGKLKMSWIRMWWAVDWTAVVKI